MNKCGLNIANSSSRSDSGVISSSVSESALSGSDYSGIISRKSGNAVKDAAAGIQIPLTVVQPAAAVVPPPPIRSPRSEAKRKEREARSIAIEKAYVHDVYEQISQHVSDNKYRAWPRVKQFLQDLEPGTLLCDVGCGSGKYLGINPTIFNIGSDRCSALAGIAREKEHEVMLCDNLALPYRDESIDALLSIAVIHHIATAERRVHALRELARVLRVGGRVMISVWAMEQKYRKFESQDVLLPWHKPPSRVGSINETGAGAAGLYSTGTATSDDDVTHYHAYTQTSDSDQQRTNPSRLKLPGLRRKNGHHRSNRRAGRSFDPTACDILEGGTGFRPPYQSSSELSSPSNETCYSFVRKALQKFSTSQLQRQLGSLPSATAEVLSDDGRGSAKFQWLRLAGLEKLASMQPDEDLDGLDSASVLKQQDLTTTKIVRGDSGDSNHSSIGDIPIELPHLEEEEDMYHIPLLPRPQRRPLRGRSLSLDCQDLELRKRVTLSQAGRAMTLEDKMIGFKSHEGQMKKTNLSASIKSFNSLRSGSGSVTSLSSAKSFVSTFSAKSDSGISLPAPKVSHMQELPNVQEEITSHSFHRMWDSDPTLNKKRVAAGSSGGNSKKDMHNGCLSNLSKATGLCSMGEKEKSKAMQSVESKLMKAIKEVNESDISENNTPLNSPGPALITALKAKKDTKFPFIESKTEVVQKSDTDDPALSSNPQTNPNPCDNKKSEGFLTFDELKAKVKAMPKFRTFHHTSGGSVDRGSMQDKREKFGKQMSLHDELLSHERLTANEEMRKKIQKQQSLPDNQDLPKRKSLKEGLMEVVSKSKQFESLKQSLVILRGNASTVIEESETPKDKEPPVEISEDTKPPIPPLPPPPLPPQNTLKSGIVRIWQSWRNTERTEGPSFTHKKGVSIQPIEVRGHHVGGKDAAGRRNIFQRRRGGSSPLSPQQLEALVREDSMSPTSFRRCCMDCPGGDIVILDQSGNMRERKLSRGGEASDSSSKDGSIQSDTSIDSEDSCVSVIFVPHPDGKFGLTGELPANEMIKGNLVASSSSTRKQSNSSESSNESGKTSPIQSPGLRLPQASPTKISTTAKLSIIDASETSLPHYHRSDSRCLPLEKIDERHTESESEAEKELLKTQAEADPLMDVIQEEVCMPFQQQQLRIEQRSLEKIEEKAEEVEGGEKVEEEEVKDQHVENKSSQALETKKPLLHRRLSSQKSFEMEDIPDEPKKKLHQSASVRRLKSPRERKRASRPLPLPPNPKYDYPIVRHHPLFAKQNKSGQSNFSSLLMGTNVRIVRGASLSSNESMDDRFDIFNPEIDDSDSDENDFESSSSSSSSEESSADSNSSVESVVSASKTDPNSEAKTDPKEDQDVVESLEINKKAEIRRQSLLSLLDENQSVLSKLRRMSGSSSNSSLNKQETTQALLAAHRASGAIPKKPLPAIVEPIGKAAAADEMKEKKKLGKVKSISFDQHKPKIVVRQSSVPVTLEGMQQSGSSSSSSNKTSPKLDVIPPRQHLSPSSNSDTSGIQVKGSHESLSELDSKSPSPCKSDTEKKLSLPSFPAQLAAQPSSTKKLIRKTSLENENHSGNSSKQESFDLPTLDEEEQCQQRVKRRILRRNNDSIESNAPSAKSSIQYSDTSSLLSHRFSTISISSNVSSSDVSISAGGHSGSSCYLASMSSTDFDDKPVLASSFSLSEAELEESNLVQKQRVKLKSAFKRMSRKSETLPTMEEDSNGSSSATKHAEFLQPRSRIGTETSIETSVENPTCIDHGESFDDELVRALSKDDDEVLEGPTGGSSSNSLQKSLSAASSNDSLHSDSGGSQTFHRYYHVFKEGELDYLINTYVDNLHIINSYYDHANWCIVAEKVNVWTI